MIGYAPAYRAHDLSRIRCIKWSGVLANACQCPVIEQRPDLRFRAHRPSTNHSCGCRKFRPAAPLATGSTLQADDAFAVVAAALFDPFQAAIGIGGLVGRLNWSAQVSVRALSGFSPEYFGATAVGKYRLVSVAPHSSWRNSFHLRPFSLPATSAARYFRAHPGTAGAGLVTSAASPGASARRRQAAEQRPEAMARAAPSNPQAAAR